MRQQLSIFAENKKGSMHGMTKLISDAGINIECLITNDSAEYGIVRMVVSDPEKALKVMQDAGYLARLDKIIAVHISDDCGSLNDLLKGIEESYINIDYLYVSYDRGNGEPLAFIKCESPEEVENSLYNRGYRLA